MAASRSDTTGSELQHMTSSNKETLEWNSLYDALGVPFGASIHDVQLTSDGIEVEYTEN